MNRLMTILNPAVSVDKKMLKLLRIIYSNLFHGFRLPELQYEKNADIASEIIHTTLLEDKPCMIARFGATELTMMTNYLGIKQGKPDFKKYLKGEALDWWWYPGMMHQMKMWSGFFPPTEKSIAKFCELMEEDMLEVDILGSWLRNEYYFKESIGKAQKVHISLLEPWHGKVPWTGILKGKKVLVIHPFAETIKSRYKIRESLFENKDMLPAFELDTVKAVQSLGGNSEFKDWFQALDWMKSEIDRRDFDYALIGCGAYGFPLAAYIKRKGKKAIHLGGILQMMFGIWGNRWNDPNIGTDAGIEKGFYLKLKNGYWTLPVDEFKPENPPENGCYW